MEILFYCLYETLFKYNKHIEREAWTEETQMVLGPVYALTGTDC